MAVWSRGKTHDFYDFSGAAPPLGVSSAQTAQGNFLHFLQRPCKKFGLVSRCSVWTFLIYCFFVFFAYRLSYKYSLSRTLSLYVFHSFSRQKMQKIQKIGHFVVEQRVRWLSFLKSRCKQLQKMAKKAPAWRTGAFCVLPKPVMASSRRERSGFSFGQRFRFSGSPG